MYLICFFVCVAIAVVICKAIPKKDVYGRLDRIGLICNVILSILYIPMSLYGIFSLFAADSMSVYSEPMQRVIYLLITVGTGLPFVSVLSIVLSVIFRKKGKRILSFIIQFIPLIIFIVMLVTFELIGNISV